MELRRLRYFVAVAEEGSVTRAAARLGLQQPPLSQQIQQLETELGVRLFDRASRGMRLNAAGRVLLDGARKTLAAAGEAIEAVQRFDLGAQGRIGVGFTSSASLHRMTPTMLGVFRAVYPEVAIEVEESETYELTLAVERRRLDAAFVRIAPSANPDLGSYTLAEEPMVVALPIRHPLAKEPGPVALAALVETPVVLYRRREGPSIYDTLSARFGALGYEPQVVDEVARMLAALNLVAAGRGASFVPASMRVIHPELVAYRPLQLGVLAPLPLNVIFRPDNEIPAVHNFVRVAQDTAER